MKKHCILWTVVITLIVSWFLFFPWSKQVFEDGGTIVYSSFTYKIYIWNSIGGKNTTEIYYFRKGQILRPTPNTAPLICGACYNTQPEDLLTMA